MATNTTTKLDRLAAALAKGRKLTANQIMRQFGFASRNSAYAALSDLREEGYQLNQTKNREGITQYSL